MQEKIVEILIHVLSEIQKTNKPLTEIDITALEKKGYTPSEISTAFSWLVDRIQEKGETKNNRQEHSFRILHAVEKEVISSEAFGYLLSLHELNLISDEELETIIERAMMSGFDKLDQEEIRMIALSVLFDAAKSDNIIRSLPDNHSSIH
jgi:uncharacterized protein Smg (DUF494 family)